MNVVRLKDKNSDVKVLQRCLKQLGWNINPDGDFGTKTETAVKEFQAKYKLGSDGIVGSKSWNCLIKLTRNPVRNVRDMQVSQDGLNFIFKHEAMTGKSEYFHHPSSASGVTLGPGYDFKQRKVDEVRKTMTAIGLTTAQVELACKAVGLTGQPATDFCKANKSAIKLTKEQEIRLLEICVLPYVDLVKRYMRIELSQNEFDCMVDFAYNPGKVLNRVCAYLNQNDFYAAMNLLDDIVKSGSQELPGLVTRRFNEKQLFVNGIY